jgi:hypothetical protein
MCAAVGRLASEHRLGPLADATIDALRAAHDDAGGGGVGRTAYRFRAPRGAEHLMSVAAIRVRRDSRQPLGPFLRAREDSSL